MMSKKRKRCYKSNWLHETGKSWLSWWWWSAKALGFTAGTSKEDPKRYGGFKMEDDGGTGNGNGNGSGNDGVDKKVG